LSVVKFELGERQPGGEFFFSFLNLFFLSFTKNIISVERFTKVDPAALYLGGKLTWHMGAGRTFLGGYEFCTWSPCRPLSGRQGASVQNLQGRQGAQMQKELANCLACLAGQKLHLAPAKV
jgi:hypothetical protein